MAILCTGPHQAISLTKSSAEIPEGGLKSGTNSGCAEIDGIAADNKSPQPIAID